MTIPEGVAVFPAHVSARRARPRAFAIFVLGSFSAVCLAALLFAGAAAPARADEVDTDLPGASLGLSESSESGRLLGFFERDRLSHSRSLSFGYAASSGPYKSQSAGASYTDFFAYRLRDNLRVALALEYRFATTSRTLSAESGEFSVLPAFALEYTPSENSVIRVSYEHASPFGPGFGRWSSSPWARSSSWDRSPFATESPDFP
jgi:hypothetical protein